MNNHAAIAALLYPVVASVMFGSFVVAILSIPGTGGHVPLFFAAAIETSLLVAAPLAWEIAPALRARRR